MKKVTKFKLIYWSNNLIFSQQSLSIKLGPNMEKSIFKKLKKAANSPLRQSQKTENREQISSDTVLRDGDQNVINSNTHSGGISPTMMLKNSEKVVHGSVSKSVPELMAQNDRLKSELDAIKNEQRELLNQHQKNLNDQFTNQGRQSEGQQFSFRRSIQNIQKQLESQSQASFSSRQIKRNNFSSVRQTRPDLSQTLSSRNRIIKPERENDVSESQKKSDQNEEEPKTQKQQSKSLGKPGAYFKYDPSEALAKTSSIQERFYKYCKSELIRVNSENNSLRLQVTELEARIQKTQGQNQTLSEQLNLVRSQNEYLEKRSEQDSMKVEKLNLQIEEIVRKKDVLNKDEVEHLQKRIEQLSQQLKEVRSDLKEKTSEIQKLTIVNSNIEQKYKNYPELVEKNIFLQNDISEWMTRNQRLKEKFVKNPTIDHLWEIKEVEFSNLVDLIQTGKRCYDSPAKNSHKQSSIGAFRGSGRSERHDLTFGKH